MTSLIDGFVSHLEAPSMDLHSKLNIASELRDSIELNQITTDQEHFVTQLLPQITRLIEQTPVSMVSTSSEHKLRHCLLDCLLRLQATEAFKPASAGIMDLILRVIQVDNEENGIVCLKIFSNLHKAYKGHLVDYVQPFFDLVVQIIGNVPQMIHELFDVPADEQDPAFPTLADTYSGNSGLYSGGNSVNHTNTSSPHNPNTPHSLTSAPATTAAETDESGDPKPASGDAGSTPNGGQHQQQHQQTPQSSSLPASTNAKPPAPSTVLFPATRSFKVLIECPIIIVLMFSSHRQLTSQSLPVLVPHIIELLTLEATPQAREHATAAARGTFFSGVAPAIRMSPHRSAYNDFVVVQIKIMSFVGFIVRAFSPALQQHLSLIPNFLVRLLKDCPPENGSVRKELIIALRHLINTEQRMLFLSKINILLEEKVLIGYGLTANECVKPVAYSTVADLIHHGRNELSMTQIWQVVRTYSKLLLDMSLGVQTQGMCLKLIMNLLDRVNSVQKPEQGRQLLMIVLKAVVNRLELINRCFKPENEAIKRSKRIIKMHSDIPHSDVKDAKFIYRNIVVFLRNLMFALKASNPQPRQRINISHWHELARGFTSDEVNLLRRLFRECIYGLKYYKEEPGATKDLIDAVVSTFTQLDPATFNEIFEQEIDFLVSMVMANPEYLHIIYLLSGNEATTCGFCTILLKYLMNRLPDVGQKDGAILLRLFKQCFSAVNLFPAINEPVILVHLRELMVKSLELANDATEPLRLFSLLEHLFRTLGGGRFDNVYKTVLPLLHFMLENLNKRLAIARTDEEKNIYAELCLTVPVRLSLMVPHLSFLMRPMAHAINAKNAPELVVQGLRTLEMCVDNLTATYFDPHVAPVLPEVLPGLWNLLKPLPFDHKLSHATLRILGKLGGRSRAYISPPQDLKHIKALDQDVAAVIQMESDTPISVRITPSVKVALHVLGSPLNAYDSEYRSHAFKLISIVMLKYIPTDPSGLDADIVQVNTQGATMLVEEVANAPELPNVHIDKQQRQIETELVEQLIRGLFLACGDPNLRDEAQKLLDQICQHVVLLELGEFNLERRRALRPFNVSEHEGYLYVAPRTFVAGIVFGLSHWLPGVSEAAVNAIKKIVETGKQLCGDETETHRYPMFRGMFAKLSHSCFEEAWYTKLGAIKGLGVILREISLPKSWLGARTIELTRTMFFVIKDTSPVGGHTAGNVPSIVSKEAADLLLYTLSQVEHAPTERYFTTLIGLLAFELESACGFCRKTAQRALEYLADVTKIGLSEMLQKVTEVFLTPIFMKPLRALPFPMQIGYSDCITYCLQLPNTFLKFNEKLMRMLDEALALVDADDESLITAHRVYEYSTAQQLTELRVVCIRLLSLSVTTSDHAVSQYPNLKSRIIHVFFKSMSAGPQPAIDAAYEGLRVVLKITPKLPKELLQNGLRPILLPLSDFKRLNFSVLDCLAQLLELLTYNFRVEIGTKLLDHLRTFSEPSRLLPISNRVLDDDVRIKLGASLINVFHMLPPTAHIFLADLVTLVIAIEDTLRRTQNSPFRAPIAKFMDRYPTHAYAYFAEKQNDPVCGRFFSDMVRRAPELAKVTTENIEDLCSRIMGQTNEEDQCIGICNLISVVDAIDVPRRVLVNLVNSVGDVVRATSSKPANSALHISVPYAIDELQRVIVKFLTKHHKPQQGVIKQEEEKATSGPNEPNDVANKKAGNESDEMEVESASHNGEGTHTNEETKNNTNTAGDADENKDMMEVESAEPTASEPPSSADFELVEITVSAVVNSGMKVVPEMTEFLWNTVINTNNLVLQQNWLEETITYVVNHEVNPESKQYIMLIANLILLVHGEKHGSLTTLIDNSKWLQKLHMLVWQNADKLIPAEGTIGNPLGSGLGIATLDKFFIKLLEMSVLLVQYAAPKIVDMRKNVIKFGWRYITVDDVFSKLSAYVLVNFFVKAFDTLPKIVVQIYFALLKTQYPEARSLVQQALDELATVIVQRVGLPVWARAPRRVLSEDGHGILGVTNVCLFLARHSKLFFPYRELYVQYIVSSMARLSYMGNQTLDVDLAELLASWEQQRHEELKSGKTESYDMPHATREAVVTYLVRFITAQPAARSRDQSSADRVMAALDNLLGLWPDAEVRLNYFDRALAHTDFASSPQALSASLDALKVVNLALKHKPVSWITENVEEIAQLLEKPLHCPIPQIHEALKPILRTALAADSEDNVLLRQVVAATVEHLSPPPPTATGANQANTAGAPRNMWVYLATEAVSARPNCLDEQMPLIIKALSRMAKERLESNAANINTNGTAVNHAKNTNNVSVDAERFISALKLVAGRVSFLGDQRRAFLTLIAHVIERVQDKQVALFILDMVNDWVFGSEPFPTIKEKAAIMHKLLVYKDSQLSERYFDIVIRVFETPRLRTTELPSRLEQPFLVGCTSSNIKVKTKLMSILNNSVDRSICKRLVYILCEQNWEPLADQLWLCQALQLLLDPIKPSSQRLRIDVPLGFAPVSVLQYTQRNDKNMESEPSASLVEFVDKRKKFMNEINEIPASDFLKAIQSLLFIEPELVHDTWIDVFPSVFKSQEFADKDRHELVKGIVMVLAKEYHIRQADTRPNVVQCLLSGLAEAGEQVPPQLTKYLATNYDAWYTAIRICENIMTAPQSDSMKVAEVNEDVLAELYAALGEEDHFYGLWRTRSKFAVTSAALSYEQCGMWQKAMQLHETAQIRARCGVLPYGESEYGLWEDHWILCAEKLQHWEVLTDIAKHEGFTDLLLECQWRLADWMTDREALASTIKTVMDVPTPRRQVFETFLSLQGFAQKTDTLQHLSQNCDEGIQLALRKWHSLPARFTQAHAPLLHTFQQYVEFMEATQVYTSLQATTALNIEIKSQELKGVMQAWHDRLPNSWDDINWWGDLAAWRQHVFGVINRVYLPLIPQLQSAQGANGNGNTSGSSAAYRGYHEIAWTINRFAHTARKQNLTDVCTTQLSKIYTLPNIEIQEAFLKLREQAKCHLQNHNELATGLDVISNTNLVFFGNSQKAEFFALKGESLTKLGQYDHAFNVLSAAVQVDMHLPNAWDAWGEFSDRRFKENPEDYMSGASAITCYLHAISLYKNRKSRKLIGRLLWLLGIDDPQGKLGEAFEEFKGETPTWYWITYIPQLLTSLSTHEGKYTSRILIKIAKAYPQALHFQLRTAREEYAMLKRLSQKQSPTNMSSGNETATPHGSALVQTATNSSVSASRESSQNISSNNTSQGGSSENHEAKQETQDRNEGYNSPALNSTNSNSNNNGIGNNELQKSNDKQPWEYTEEIMGVLKTAYPLLALSLETLIDQMSHRFKSPADEDAYRLIVALLNDGLSFMGRKQCIRDDEHLPPHAEANVSRFAESVISEQTRPQFEADFVNPRPTLDAYISRLRKWRDRLEDKLDARPYRVNLESLSPPLGEFHYQKFEEVEIPGQSMELRDDNHYFLKIGRFVPHVDLVRSNGVCYRRITIQATDGSLHTFAVQYPTARNCRREDRVSQVFKILGTVMQHRTEARRRNLQFTLPNAVSLNMHIRMVQDDPNFISFYQIYEKFCRARGQSKDAPFDYTVEQMRAAIDPNLPKPDTTSIKVEILSGIQAKLVPQTIMRDFFIKQYRSYEDFWLFRKQFAYQYAAVSFMTVMMSVNSRYPHKFQVNLNSGNIWATEMLPIVSQTNRPPTYLNGELVAFRMTPNLQYLMSQHVIEGIFAPTMMVIAKSLTDPEFDLQQFLPLFVRDELISWFANHLNPEQRIPRGITSKQAMQEVIKCNVETIARRASSLCQAGPANSVANQTILDLISLTANPRSLASTDILWMPYF